MIVAGALTLKLVRDLLRMWPQVLAIALVMASGVATLVLSVGAYNSLEDTRRAYYERNLFGDIFASATRAPEWLGEQMRMIDGVAAVETRVEATALLDMPGLAEPATGRFISLPQAGRQSAVNRLTVRSGRLPLPLADDEAAVSEAFAEANGLRPGDVFTAILDGHRRALTVVGTVLGPEFVYALGPGQIMPDPRRYGIVFMAHDALAAAFDLEGAFSGVALRLRREASRERVSDAVDLLLAPYGGTGAYGRDDHPSNAFLDAELMQMRTMSRVLPPIFLLVAAFLVNMTMSRLIALERTEIGLLKALGYGTVAVAAHYLKFVAAIALVGVVIGAAAGTWLGVGLTRLYGEFFNFPFLVFHKGTDIYAIAALVTLAAAIAGALAAVLRVVGLAPAVAMSPPAPTQYRRRVLGAPRWLRLPQIVAMTVRHLTRFPLRTATSVLGVALSLAILLGSMWSFGSVDYFIDVTFFRAERQDATITFSDDRPFAALFSARRLPGVLRAEPFRAVPAKLRRGHVERRISIVGTPPGADLSRVLDEDLAAVAMPGTGIALSSALATILGARIGDLVEVELVTRDGRTEMLPVSDIITGYLGLGAYMDLAALNRLMREGPVISGVQVAMDDAARPALFSTLKEMPAASAIALRAATLSKFEETVAHNITIMVTVYVGLAVIISLGVVYNFARVSLSERARELASLRVLGFTRGEVARILLAEIGAVVVLALPLGWVMGYALAWATVSGFESELYRMPLIMGRSVYAVSSLIVVGAAVLASLLVWRRIDRLDLIEVLKTRE